MKPRPQARPVLAFRRPESRRRQRSDVSRVSAIDVRHLPAREAIEAKRLLWLYEAMDPEQRRLVITLAEQLAATTPDHGRVLLDIAARFAEITADQARAVGALTGAYASGPTHQEVHGDA